VTIHLRSNGHAVVEHPDAMRAALNELREHRRVVDEDIGELLHELQRYAYHNVKTTVATTDVLIPVNKPVLRFSNPWWHVGVVVACSIFWIVLGTLVFLWWTAWR